MDRDGIIHIAYATSSEFKIEENNIFINNDKLDNDTFVREKFKFDIRNISIKEVLEVDLKEMVEAESIKAYDKLKVPCIVEHAGLIFEKHRERSYPGGLTKPMWKALGDQFISETNSSNIPAIARAVVGYCDGVNVYAFVGETYGSISPIPAGDRSFYWDTIFIPNADEGNPEGLTYAQIASNPKYGLNYKVLTLSQSSRAMRKLLEHLVENGGSTLWS